MDAVKFRRQLGQAGFTLVEMVTVISMISVLSALVIANTRTSNDRQGLRTAANQFVAAARSAESQANSSRQVGSPAAARKSYGVCVSTTSANDITQACARPTGSQKADKFQVFARIDAVVSQAVLATRPVNSIAIETYQLPKGFVFDLSGFDPQLGFYLDYLPPTAAMYVGGAQTETTLAIKKEGATSTCTSTNPDCQIISLKPLAGAVYVQ